MKGYIAAIVMCLLFLAAYGYGDAKARASCTESACEETYYEIIQSSFPNILNDYSETTAILLRGNLSLSGSPLAHATLRVDRETNCKGSCNCSSCPGAFVYEGTGFSSCTPAGDIPRYFCAKNKIGVTGSWNAGEGP